MKKYLVLIMFIVVSFAAFGQVDSVTVKQSSSLNWFDFMVDNWVSISTILLYIVYRLVPTKQADFIKAVIDWLWNIIPDNKKGGGKH